MAVPVALSFVGMYGVMLGLWMLETLISPLADFVTASGALLPSDPGAPAGQSGISCGVWALIAAAPASMIAASSGFDTCIRVSLLGMSEYPAGSVMPVATTAPAPPPVPHTFLEYVRSFGPGIVVVLTWLGAGDVVDMATAGANYGYALLWVFAVAILFRFLFVSLIVRYHLCNQHGEGVLDGLVRLNRLYAPVLFIAAIVMGHVYGSYMTRGVGEVCRNVFGFGAIWQWAVACNALAFYLVFRPSYRGLELVFFVFLAVLSASFLGCAVWVGFNPADVARGLVRMEMPGQHGAFDPWQVALAMIGAVGGSLMNLVYPYFLDEKGWRGPRYRRVQFYDFLLGVIAMFVLNLSIWVLGAELLYPDKHIETLDDLPNLLSTMLGNSGRLLFYAGIFSAIYTSIIGHAAGLGRLGTHAWLRWTTPSGPISG